MLGGWVFGMRQWRYWLIASAIAIVSIFVACSNNVDLNSEVTQKPVSVKNELNIWWEQGYNLAEDETLRRVVARWQKKTGNKVKLSFFTNDELIAKAERAIRVNRPPDLMMSLKGNRVLYPRLAWEDKLEDVADIIEPVKDDYSKPILQAITYANSYRGKRSYYGVPVHQSTVFIFYWRQLLASVGLNSQDIPQDWDDFWQFWQQVQTKLKQEKNLDIYGLGLTLAEDSRADDTYNLFEQILEANNINLLSDRGELKIDNPKVRQGIIKCLDWYARLYRQGYIPPDAVEWSNADNNRHFLNRSILMTPNNSLSIPATVRQDPNIYYDRLGIMEFPNKPDGKPMRYILNVRQAVIFKDASHRSLAKEFLRYFIQPQVKTNYLKAIGGRHQPVQKSVWQNPFWQDIKDPYIATATKILTQGQTRLPYEVYHPAYSQVLAENVWGKALTQITANKISSKQAADLAIVRIEAIFAQWDRELQRSY